MSSLHQIQHDAPRLVNIGPPQQPSPLPKGWTREQKIFTSVDGSFGVQAQLFHEGTQRCRIVMANLGHSRQQAERMAQERMLRFIAEWSARD